MEKKFVRISDLKPIRRGLNIRALVLEKGEVVEGVSRKTGMPYKLAEALLGDESGIVKATLWGNAVDRVEPGKTYEFYNINTTLFRNSLRVNISDRTKIAPSQLEIKRETVNTSNNVSRVRKRK